MEQTEQEFLKKYDASKYQKPSVAADIVIFSVWNDDGKTDDPGEKELKILLIKRGKYPYKDMYALPGGFVNIDETIEDAARRELLEETGVDCDFLEQLRTTSTVDRDPRYRVISASYIAVLDAKKYSLKAGDDASDVKWFTVSMKQDEHKEWVLKLKSNVEELKAVLHEEKKSWIPESELTVLENEGLAFDHALIIGYAMLKLKQWGKETDFINIEN